jgi:acyl-coenzyme A thioesterase PaaI-like protein
MDLKQLVSRAQNSSFRLWLLNIVLLNGIPFNKPHKLRVIKVTNSEIEIRLPYRRRNLNHLKGLHACGLATLCEYAAGLLLSHRLDVSKYRMIMRSMNMQYHYQGKTDATARFGISEEWLKEKILDPLQNSDSVFVLCEVQAHDTQGNLLCTGTTEWQVKNWTKVKVKP